MNKAYVLAILELLVIVSLLFYFYNFRPLASSSDVTLSSLKEPPTLTTKINGTVSLKNDLESLGCKIINSTEWSNTCGLTNYTDFRGIAYNSGVVFWYDTGILTAYSSTWISVTLFTIFGDNIFSFSKTFYLVT